MKVPATPPTTFAVEPRHLRAYQGQLWRIYRATGPHAVAWDELRHWGPAGEMRFDPHPLPQGDHPDVGVMYAATDPITALGEVYQDGRSIDRSAGGATIVAWVPTRDLALLDLTTNWPVLNGAAAAMMMDDKAHTSTWARAIYERLGDDIDGLYHQSSITNKPIVTLFSRTERQPAFPARPLFHVAVADSALHSTIDEAKRELGYTSA